MKVNIFLADLEKYIELINNDFLEIIVQSDNLFKDVYANEIIFISLFIFTFIFIFHIHIRIHIHIFPQLGSPTGPKGVLCSFDGRCSAPGPVGSPSKVEKVSQPKQIKKFSMPIWQK